MNVIHAGYIISGLSLILATLLSPIYLVGVGLGVALVALESVISHRERLIKISYADLEARLKKYADTKVVDIEADISNIKQRLMMDQMR